MSRERKLQRVVLAHMWCERIVLNQQDVKPKNTISFKKKKKKDKEKGNCFTCGKTEHFSRDCQMRSGNHIRGNQ
jgi:hypothetical protein